MSPQIVQSMNEELKLAAVKAMQDASDTSSCGECLSRLEVGVGELGEDGRESAR